MGDLPRNAREALIEVDSMLVDVTERVLSHRYGRELSAISVAVDEVTAVLGPSGRPVGAGDPGGGRGAARSSSVEVAVLGPDDPAVEDGSVRVQRRRRDPADAAHDQLVRLPAAIVDQVLDVVLAAGLADEVPAPPWNAPVWRLLVWCRWGVRRVHDRESGLWPPMRSAQRLHSMVVELREVVVVWSRPGTPPETAPVEPGGLVQDLTGQWCTSCLRIGHREHRHHKHSKQGLCRWCGDWQAEHGWLPTRPLLEAHRDGQRITPSMVKRATPAEWKKRRKR